MVHVKGHGPHRGVGGRADEVVQEYFFAKLRMLIIYELHYPICTFFSRHVQFVGGGLEYLD